MSNSLQSHGLDSPWNSPGQNTGVMLFPSPGDLPNPGIKPRSPTMQADSLPAEPQRKPKNTGVGSVSLLQRIFPIQELNWGLPHCRQIIYQLRYQGTRKELQIQLGLCIPGFCSCGSPNSGIRVCRSGTHGCGSWLSCAILYKALKHPCI